MQRKPFISSLLIAGLLVLLASMFVVAAGSPAGRVEYLVPRITCGSCAQTISTELEKLAGVSQVEVDVATTTVRVNFDEKQTDAGVIALALNQSGYPGRIIALNGQVAPGADPLAKKAGGCGGNCCDKKTK